MRISLQPMNDHRANTIAAIDQYCSHCAVVNSNKEQAWINKREQAEAFKNGSTPTDEFSAEAALRGLSADAFADMILAKPDPRRIALKRELARQTALLAVENAKSPDQLEMIFQTLKGECNG